MEKSLILKGTLPVLSLLGAAGLTSCRQKAQEARPNVIYLLFDDLGYGELGCYGQEFIETPNIDKLAENGVRFTQNYSGCAVSAPSRCVLMTGLHTGHAYVRGNDELGSRGDVWSHEAMLADSTLEGQAPMPAGTKTIGHMMQQAGYATACIGKWGLGYPGSESTPNKMGFDYFYGYNCQRQAHSYYPMFLYENERRMNLDNAPLLIPHQKLAAELDPRDAKNYEQYTRKEYSCDLMFDKMVDFISDNKENPFMLMWTTPIPHVALQAPKEWIYYYEKKFGDEAPYTGNTGYLPTRYPHATYAAMVSYIDQQVGVLVDLLKELGIYDNTIIIVTSDNGPTYNGGTDSQWFDSGGPFDSKAGWGKGSLHEGGIRVPMVVSWPAKIKPGGVSDHICAFWDVMPTLADATGAEAPANDGISFLPALLGEKQPQHEYMYWEFPEGGGSKAVRMGKWKGLIRDIKKGNTRMELFDLAADPGETTDVSADHPEVVMQILEIMEKAHEEPENANFRM